VRRIRSPCKIDGCPAFHQCLILAQELGLGGNHVYPTASPAACFAGAGRLIAPVVHHIQIVSDPTGNIHIAVAQIALDATQLRRSLVLTRRNTHQQNDFRLIERPRECLSTCFGRRNCGGGPAVSTEIGPPCGITDDGLATSLGSAPVARLQNGPSKCLTARLLGCNASDACDTPALFSPCHVPIVPGAAINQAQREAALIRSTFTKSIANKPLL